MSVTQYLRYYAAHQIVRGVFLHALYVLMKGLSMRTSLPAVHLMHPRQMAVVMVALVAVFVLFVGNARAATLTVDGDRIQCPLADYTDLNVAVSNAAQGDTIYICDGTYLVPGGPSSSGLRIEKNISLRGAGADKVFIQPDGTAPSMESASPNPRDEYGNVITVRRRLVQLFNVNISGMTIRAAGTAIEGGLAMIDVTEGTVSGVKIEGFLPEDGPGTGAYSTPGMIGQGQGLILANTIESHQNEIRVSGTEISGFNSAGVLVDNRVITGDGWIGNNSRMIAHLDGVSITGSGFESSIGQNGVEIWTEGASAVIRGSRITGTGLADSSAAAVLLRGAKADATVIGGSAEDANDLSGNDFGIANHDYDGTAPGLTAPAEARRNFWGSLGPGASAFVATPDVTWRPAVSTQPEAPQLDPVTDLAPSIEWDLSPEAGEELPIGEPVDLAVLASDDFGVNRVEFNAGNVELGPAPTPELDAPRLYESEWTPTEEDAGEEVTFTATAVDSSGQESSVSVTAVVAALPPTCETDPEMEGCEPPPTCETNPEMEGCPPPPTCETNPEMEGCPPPPTCETNPEMEGCPPPPTCETNPSLDGCEQPVATIRVNKPVTITMRRGVRRVIAVRVTNTGGAPATGVRVCPTVGRGLLRPRTKVWIPKRCLSLGMIAPGTSKVARIGVRASRALARKRFNVRLAVRSTGASPRETTALVRLRR